jgi:hypothetical protein
VSPQGFPLDISPAIKPSLPHSSGFAAGAELKIVAHCLGKPERIEVAAQVASWDRTMLTYNEEIPAGA